MPKKIAKKPKIKLYLASIVVVGLAGAFLLFSSSAAPLLNNGNLSITSGQTVMTITNPPVNEASGTSMWGNLVTLLNDSGGKNELYAYNGAGHLVATVAITGATNSDWEGLEIVKNGSGGYDAYIGDIGDNARSRSTIKVYKATLPAVDESKTGQNLQTTGSTLYRFVYADGPRDAEGLVVHPVTKRIYIVSKQSTARLYEAPTNLSTSANNTLTYRGDIPVTTATGAAISQDGKYLAVTRYKNQIGKVYKLTSNDVGAQIATAEKFDFTTPDYGQSEAVAFTNDSKHLLISTEGGMANPPIWGMPNPAYEPNSSNSFAYPIPQGAMADSVYDVTIAGEQTFVYPTPYGGFTSFRHTGGAIQLTVVASQTVNNIDVKPASKNVVSRLSSSNDKRFYVTITEPGQYSVDVNGADYPLFIFANPPETNVPNKNDGNVMYYAAGQVYDVGELIVASNKTVYIEGGAILKGKIRTGTCCTSGATSNNINISGYGIVDSTQLADPGRPLRINRTTQIAVDGPVFLGTEAWGAVAFESNDVVLNNIKVINWRSTSGGTPDGIDIVGSSNVNISNVFVRSYDDGIAIKNNKFGWSGDVENVDVSGAVIWNGDAGNGLEIGYENNANYIRNITYSDIDIIRKTARQDPYKRAAISIHIIDGAQVSSVLYDDIRVEEAQENYIYLSAFKSGSSETSNIGTIKDVTFKNVSFSGAPKALPIVLNGYDAARSIDGVTFEDLTFADSVITNASQVNLQANNVKNLQFTTSQSTNLADINNDTKVDIVDLSILLSAWGTNNTASDINTDGKVDIVDLSILLSNWS